MTDKSKAKELADFLYFSLSHIDYDTLTKKLLEMAQWKKQETIGRAEEWLKKNTVTTPGAEHNQTLYTEPIWKGSKETFIKNFKQDMMEEVQ